MSASFLSWTRWGRPGGCPIASALAKPLEFLLRTLKENERRIRKIRAFVLPTAYNAPSSMEAYYTALVNYDLRGGTDLLYANGRRRELETCLPFLPLAVRPVNPTLAGLYLGRKVAGCRREAGFFANTTHGLEIDALRANRHYKLREAQEKYFALLKGILGADRLRASTESGKMGRAFVLFCAQIPGCYLSYVRSTKLSEHLHFATDVLKRDAADPLH